MLYSESSSVVIKNDSINKIVFNNDACFVNDKSIRRAWCLNSYSDTSDVIDNVITVVSSPAEYIPQTKKFFKNKVSVFIDKVTPLHINVRGSSKILIDGGIESIDNNIYTDSAVVLNKSVPIVEDINGIKMIKIQCQTGMYFELELDVLKVAECVYSLPKGIKYSSSKIYGTPMSYGIFKSYLTIDDNNVIELFFDIRQVQRVF